MSTRTSRSSSVVSIELNEQNGKTTKEFTCEEVLEAIGMGPQQYIILCLAAFAYMAYCAELIMILLCREEIKRTFNVSTSATDWLVFAGSLTNLIGGQFWGMVADSAGRKPVFTVALLIGAVFGTSCAFASSFALLVLFRCISQFGISGVSALDYLYVIEQIPTSHRALYSSSITVLGSLGLLYVAGVAWGVHGVLNWRYVFGIGAIPLVISAIMRFVFALESPRFLATRGREAAAWKVFEKLCPKSKRPLADLLGVGDLSQCKLLLIRQGEEEKKGGEKVQSQLATADDSLSPQNPKSHQSYGLPEKVMSLCGEWREAIKQSMDRLYEVFSRANLRQTITLGILWFTQSFGYWSLFQYLPQYYTLLGVNPRMEVFLNVAAQTPALVIAGFIMDRKCCCKWFPSGRRQSLRLFSCCAASVLGLMSALVGAGLGAHLSVGIVRVMLFFFIVPIWNALFIYTPENYSTSIRATAFAFLAQVGTVPQIITSFSSSAVLKSSKNRPWLYPFVISAIYVFFFFVTFMLKNETSGGRPLPDCSGGKAATSDAHAIEEPHTPMLSRSVSCH